MLFTTMFSSGLRGLYSVALFLLLLDVSRASPTHSHDDRWVATWTSMPQLVEPANLPPAPFNGTTVFANTTLRQTLSLSLPATQHRVHISNTFGTSPLSISSVTIALPASGKAGVSAIQAGTLKKVTFSGSSTVTVPPGALIISDPVDFTVLKSQTNVAVTLYVKTGQTGAAVTGHPGSRTTSWMTFGDQAAAVDLSGVQKASTDHWYLVSTVDAWLPEAQKALVIVGDSITDGRGSDTNGNNRWPDQLLARLQKSPGTANIALANQAAGGNRVLADGLGPSAVSRIDRDVIAQSGVGWVLLFEGVNDIGVAPATTLAQQQIGDQLIAGFENITARVHAAGLPVFGGTISPLGVAYFDPTREAARQRVNTWIRTSGTFDRIVDFDEILRDPAHQDKLNPLYDGSGDGLHPNVIGYQKVADAFPVAIFYDKFK